GTVGRSLSAALPNLGLVSRAARGIWPDDSPTTCHPARCQCQERPWRSTMRRLPSLSPALGADLLAGASLRRVVEMPDGRSPLSSLRSPFEASIIADSSACWHQDCRGALTGDRDLLTCVGG